MRKCSLCFRTLTSSAQVSLAAVLVSIKTATLLNSLSTFNEKKQTLNIVVGVQIERQNLYFYGCTNLGEATRGAAFTWGNGAIWVFLLGSRLWF